MTQLIDGKAFAANLRLKLQEEVSHFTKKPGLAVVLVGEDPASGVYVAAKEKACAEIGIASFPHKLPASTSQTDLITLINLLNQDKNVNGILVQLPLPSHINESVILEAISPKKDVDGFHPINSGLLHSGSPNLIPCTPLGCILLLKSLTNIAGKNALVIGRSNIVGKPVAALLLNESATVTIAHSKTHDLQTLVKQADIVVAAVGRPNMIKGEWLKKGCIVIDVGINRIEIDGKKKLVGDVDTASCLGIAAHITPVPGGVGPMTIACLMQNTVTAFKKSK